MDICTYDTTDTLFGLAFNFLSVLLSGQPFNPHIRMTTSVTNIICSIVFGERYEYDDDALQEIHVLLDKFGEVLETMWIQVWLHLWIIYALCKYKNGMVEQFKLQQMPTVNKSMTILWHSMECLYQIYFCHLLGSPLNINITVLVNRSTSQNVMDYSSFVFKCVRHQKSTNMTLCRTNHHVSLTPIRKFKHCLYPLAHCGFSVHHLHSTVQCSEVIRAALRYLPS